MAGDGKRESGPAPGPGRERRFFAHDRDNSGDERDVRTMPIRLTQVGALGYDPAHVRLPPDSVGVSASLP